MIEETSPPVPERTANVPMACATGERLVRVIQGQPSLHKTCHAVKLETRNFARSTTSNSCPSRYNSSPFTCRWVTHRRQTPTPVTRHQSRSISDLIKKKQTIYFYLRNDLVERLSFANEVLAQSQFFLGRFREHIFIYVGRTGFHPVLLHRDDLHAPKEKTLLDATNHIPHIRVRSFLHRLNQNNITRRN